MSSHPAGTSRLGIGCASGLPIYISAAEAKLKAPLVAPEILLQVASPFYSGLSSLPPGSTIIVPGRVGTLLTLAKAMSETFGQALPIGIDIGIHISC